MDAALDGGIVTVTPVVVAPNPIGPLGPLNASSVPPPTKRTKGVFGAFTFGADASVPAEEAESVCYHVQLCGMPGKFDPVKAEALGVPRGKMRGQLVRGEDVTIGRWTRRQVIDVVGEAQRGARFIVVDCPTAAHLRELSDSQSSAGAALAKLAEGDGTPRVPRRSVISPASCTSPPRTSRRAKSTDDGWRRARRLRIHRDRKSSGPAVATPARESAGDEGRAGVSIGGESQRQAPPRGPDVLPRAREGRARRTSRRRRLPSKRRRSEPDGNKQPQGQTTPSPRTFSRG